MSISAMFEEVSGLFAAGRGNEVEAVLARHLSAAESDADLSYQLAVRNEQIGFYRNTGDNVRSLSMCQAALDLLDRGAAASEADRATTLLNVATAYRAAGQSARAVELYTEAEALYWKELSPTDPFLAALYNNAAQAYLQLDEPLRAAEYLSLALGILECNPGTEEQIALTHSNIAVLYLRVGELDEAGEHLQKARAISDTLPDSANRGAILGALASLNYQKGNFADAVSLYHDAMQATERVYGRNAGWVSMQAACELAQKALEAQA